MNTLKNVLREILGLFVEDGSFAVQILAIVVLAGFSTTLAPGVPFVAGGILVLGCLGVLFVSVVRGGRR